MHNLGFLRFLICSPKISLGNVSENEKNILDILQSINDSASFAIFPELSLTGSSLEDLFSHPKLHENVLNSLKNIVNASLNYNKFIIIGLPLLFNNSILNVAAVIHSGDIIAFVPKDNLSEYDSRFFSTISSNSTINLFSKDIPILINPIFQCDGFTFTIKLGNLGLLNTYADIIINPCANPCVVNSETYTKNICESVSRENNCAVLYCNSGYGESSSYAVYNGLCMGYELGECISISDSFIDDNNILYADIDTNAIKYRKLTNTNNKISDIKQINIDVSFFSPLTNFEFEINRHYDKLPFLPRQNKDQYYNDILNILSSALIKRIRSINTNKLVLGFSGGLDSTVALLISYYTFIKYSLDTQNIHAISMPGFGTSTLSKSNASSLIKMLNVTSSTIDITDSVKQHFNDINHDISTHDTTYENSQARERTQILMDMSNKIGAIVIGTGDLSESALGFCTYNGDHMSMYNINASLSKTLMREFVLFLAKKIDVNIYENVANIVNAPVSPELLPLNNGKVEQKTEDILGSYQLHDFFIYHLLYNGADRDKLLYIAKLAFFDTYNEEYISNTLNKFISRFFSQQFKRNCSPDTPAVFEIALSPHKGFHFPSDIKSFL